MQIGPLKTSSRYLAALGVVAVSALSAETLYVLTGSTRLSMVFLAGVLVVAYALGSGPAYLAAGTAFLIYNFYWVGPPLSLSLGTAEDFITLGVFLAVAMLTGNLTGRVRDQAARAQMRAQATAHLFEATKAFSASSEEAFIREQLAKRLALAARGQALVKDGAQIACAPDQTEPEPAILEELTELEQRGNGSGSTPALTGGWLMRPLRTDEGSQGMAAWRTLGAPLTTDEETLLEILADVGAAAIARARLSAAKAHAEARARTEDLRNALLSSISHDLRTPLAAVLASASSLYEFGEEFDPAVRRDLAATIQEEAVRLDAFVANLLNMSRLQSGSVAIQRTAFSVAEAVRTTVERRTRVARHHVTLSIEPGAPDAWGDPVLFEQALGNVVDNALRYTEPTTAIVISVGRSQSGLSVRVRDEGPGVPAADLDRIFQKFYRSPGASGKPGTGLGLSIARGLIEAMDGCVMAANRTDAPSGLEVTMTLPPARP